jgi:glutathionyl-hydroquinone reductase
VDGLKVLDPKRPIREADVCDIAGMKCGVFSKAGPVGSNGIVPIGPTVDYTRPHDRDRLARRN